VDWSVQSGRDKNQKRPNPTFTTEYSDCKGQTIQVAPGEVAPTG